MRRAAGIALVFTTACMPPSVRAVDQWLTGYAALDKDLVLQNTWPGDRELVARGLTATATAPTSLFAMALPPLPTEHEIIEIEKKQSDDRHIVLTRITMKNPLPFEAERVGQVLADIPKTRKQRRRFLAVREGDTWGVKLDLDAVMRRAAFASRVYDLIGKGKLDEAQAMLPDAPPPPDEASSYKKNDRLVETLTEELKKARTKTSTSTPTR